MPARTFPEVALSIVAEIVSLRRSRREEKSIPSSGTGESARPGLAEDPVCRMKVDPKTAPASFLFAGVTYYFCNPHCKNTFEKSPQKYLSSEARP